MGDTEYYLSAEKAKEVIDYLETKIAMMQIAEGKLRRNMRRRIRWLSWVVAAEAILSATSLLLLLWR